MHEVNTVSLNGNAWQIEIKGCQALAAYLKSAENRLTGDPDRAEILADLEQAIADKLSRHVSAHKNVVTADEITLVLNEMGPVETGAPGAAGAEQRAGAAASPDAGAEANASANPGARTAPDSGGAAGHEGYSNATRHLFRIREGGMVGGVCNGLAAFFAVDVTLVRVVFVLMSVFTGGIGAAVYLVMMIVVPMAVTAEQMAAAHGKPFNAEELIGRPQGAQAAFDAGRHWREQWREQRRMWRDQRRQWRRQRHAWSGFAPAPTPPPYGWHAPYPGSYAPAPGLGPVGAIIRIVLLVAFISALVGAASGRPLLGWDWEDSVPRWVGIVAVCVIYGTLVKQMHMARYYGYVGVHSPGHAIAALIGNIVWLMVVITVGWYVLHHWPQVQDFLQRALDALQAAFGNPPTNSVRT